jgi:predicted Zn-dependent peptidase
MTKRVLTVLALLALAALAPAGGKKPYESFKYPKLADLKHPEVVQFTLPNGLRVMVVEDHHLPLVAGRLMLRAGSVFDPADKAGLSGVAMEVLRTGGTSAMTGDQIDEFLENRAASIETGGGAEFVTVFFDSLSEDFGEVFPLFGRVIQDPGFREDKIALAKDQFKSGISRRNDEPRSIVFREFSRILWGKDSPYTRLEEYATIDAIMRDDLAAFHRAFFHPENAILAVWGDVQAEAVRQAVQAAFAGWEKGSAPAPAYPALALAGAPGVYFTDKSDLNQGYIVLGHRGIRMDNPDYFAVEVMNKIFGTEGFSSRLMQRIRTEKGLTYGIFGGIEAGYAHDGTTTIFTFTKSGSVVEAVRAIEAEVKALMERGVTQEELDRAKDGYLNKFVFNFDNMGQIVRRMQVYTFYGFPQDFILKTKAGIEKVTVADVNRVAKQYWAPGQFIIYVVGNGAEIQPPLDGLGKVQAWDIAIPKPKGEALPEATADTLAKGTELMKTAAAKAGGEKLAALKGVRSVMKMTVSMGGQEFAMDGTSLLVFPDKVRVEMATPMGAIVQAYDGKKAWVETPQGKQNVPADDMVAELNRGYLPVLRAVGREGVTFQFLQEEGGMALLAVKGLGEDLTVGIDAEGRLAELRYQGKTPTGFGAVAERYSDFRPVGGVVMPFKVEAYADGTLAQKVVVSEQTLDPAVDPKLFGEGQ